ncbi:hypothetical protein DXG01_013924 [Tephrocybe rancida]|nr:hypothetical protein DXG01_013924 [Tephrocybe rancida]
MIILCIVAIRCNVVAAPLQLLRQIPDVPATSPPMHLDGEHSANERTVLLASLPSPHKPKPLPWFQVSIVLLIQICEPITSTSICPYINQLVSELDITGGDERKVGYYAGLIVSESLFFVTEAITVLQWSRISDHIGRKPIMLIGLFGTVLSILSFGLSRTFWALVASRCLCGLLNGNSGVMKSAMGELTDPSNRAQGFSLMPAVWAAGATLGPLFGGTLARPAENFPSLFGGAIWKTFPYFLPCVATSGFVFITFLITAIFLNETALKKVQRPLSESSDASYMTLVESSDTQRPLPLHKLLVYPVLLSIANYMTLAFLDVANIALLPLFLSMPLDNGGLGFTPATIGYIMGIYGCFTGLLHAFTFTKIVRYVGERRLFICSMSTFLPLFVLPPIMSISAERFGVNWFTWICIGVMIVLLSFMMMGFGCIFIIEKFEAVCREFPPLSITPVSPTSHQAAQRRLRLLHRTLMARLNTALTPSNVLGTAYSALSLPSSSSYPQPPHIERVHLSIITEEFLKFQADQERFAAQHVELYMLYLRHDSRAGEIAFDQEKATSAALPAKLVKEHSDTYIGGIQLHFDLLARHFDLSWNRARLAPRSRWSSPQFLRAQLLNITSTTADKVPLFHLKHKVRSNWKCSNNLTGMSLDILHEIAISGTTFQDSNALLTGVGKGSIGMRSPWDFFPAVLTFYNRKAVEYYQPIFQTFGSGESALTAVPFNQTSKQGVEALVDYAVDVLPRASFQFNFPTFEFSDSLSGLFHLCGLIDLEKVVVVTGFADVGPWGSACTRREMEARGEFTIKGCIEMA